MTRPFKWPLSGSSAGGGKPPQPKPPSGGKGTSRRGVLSGTVAAVLAGSVTASGQAAPSPILAAAREAVRLEGQRDYHGGKANVAAIRRQQAQEQAILAATPTSPADAIVLLMVALSEIGVASGFVGAEEIGERGEAAARRAVRFLAGHHGVNLPALGGELWIPAYMDEPREGAVT